MLTLTLASVGTPAYAAAGPAPEPDDDGASGFDEAEADAELEPSPAEEKAARQIVGGVVMASLGLILGVTAFGLVGARATCELEGDAECAKNMRIAALSTGPSQPSVNSFSDWRMNSLSRPISASKKAMRSQP